MWSDQHDRAAGVALRPPMKSSGNSPSLSVGELRFCALTMRDERQFGTSPEATAWHGQRFHERLARTPC